MASPKDVIDGKSNEPKVAPVDMKLEVVVIPVSDVDCRNTLPFVKSWHDRYREKGLTVNYAEKQSFEQNIKHLSAFTTNLLALEQALSSENDRTFNRIEYNHF